MNPQIPVRCRNTELTPISTLIPHPKNPNKHPKEQITRLAKIIQYAGWRQPIVVSTRSGYITKGHGRLLAAKELCQESVPVEYQDYEDEDQEYQDIVADNAIASWSELDLSSINAFLPEFDPSFDIELLGLKNFLLEPAEKFIAEEHWSELPEFEVRAEDYKAVVIFEDKDKRDEFLKLLNVKDFKRFAKDKLWSLRWPQ